MHGTERPGGVENLWTRTWASSCHHPFMAHIEGCGLVATRPDARLPASAFQTEKLPSLRRWDGPPLAEMVSVRTKYLKIETILLPNVNLGRMDPQVCHIERSSRSNRWACGSESPTVWALQD
jgi:hypothetical protein